MSTEQIYTQPVYSTPLRFKMFKRLLVLLERNLGLYFLRIRERELIESPTITLPTGYRVECFRGLDVANWSDDELTSSDLISIRSWPEQILCASYMTAVFCNDRLVSYAWATSDAAPFSNALSINCQESRYSFKAFTQPEFRGQRLSTVTSMYSDRVFIDMGICKAVSYTNFYNFSSIRTEKSKGNRYVGFAGYFNLFGFLVTFRSRGAKATGFQLVAND